MYLGAEGGGSSGPTLHPALHETPTQYTDFAHNRSKVSHQEPLLKIRYSLRASPTLPPSHSPASWLRPKLGTFAVSGT